MKSSRPCNRGPVPEYSKEKLTDSFVQYIDSELVDTNLFELGVYAEKQKGSGLLMSGLAKLVLMIIPILLIAPHARLHKVDVRKSFLDALAERPRRIVFPKVPRGDLAERVSRQVDYGKYVFLF